MVAIGTVAYYVDLTLICDPVRSHLVPQDHKGVKLNLETADLMGVLICIML